MKLLLDTHAALWLLADDAHLSTHGASLIEDPDSEVLLSAAVVWEVAIKRATGKLDAPPGFTDLLLGEGVDPLPITIAHAETAGALPPHHRDPFDRMLVAQAQIEQAVIVSGDPVLRAYDVRVEW